MSSPWGLPVHNSLPLPVASGDYCVDSGTLIVRNPGWESEECVHVHGLWETTGGCSGVHLHDGSGVGLLVHKSPVPTGTTGILGLLMKRR